MEALFRGPVGLSLKGSRVKGSPREHVLNFTLFASFAPGSVGLQDGQATEVGRSYFDDVVNRRQTLLDIDEPCLDPTLKCVFHK